MNTRLLFFLLGLGTSSLSNAQVQTSAQVISAIQKSYSSINQGVSSGVFLKQTKSFPYCAGAIDQDRFLWSDRKGVTRKYQEQGGTDDSAASVSHYFSDQGKLQFVLIEVNRVMGTQETLRVYYDSFGRIIRFVGRGDANQSLLWSFIRTDPKQAFQALYSCGR